MTETTFTTCNRDCPDACRIRATVTDGRVTRLGGDPNHPVTRGFLCYRTSHYLETQYSPDRVVQPQLRRGDGFVSIGWDEALDLAADRLRQIVAESGPAAIFHYKGGGSLGMLLALTSRLFDALGPVTVKRGDICSGAGNAAQMLDFGESDSHDLFDLENARHILLWGKNVVTSSPHTIPVLKRARARGADLLLIDPVHHRTASLCDRYVQVRPGGDFALAMAIARRLFERGLTDPSAPTYCDNFDEFRALCHERSVDVWCQAAEVSTEVADDLATRLAEGPTAILVGWGMGRRVNGGTIVRALDALGAISGNLGVPGGGVSFYFKRKGAFDTEALKLGAGPPRTICEPRFGPEVLAASDPPIRAIWVTAGNPVAMLPDSASVAESLGTRDFVVVCDAFMTDTARLAHLVLPTPTLLEADDLVGAYGHHYLGVVRPVVQAPPGVRSDLEIVQGLAERLGLSEAVAGDARSWKERLLRDDLKSLGVTVDGLAESPTRNPLVPHVLYAERRFPTPSGNVVLMTTRDVASPSQPVEGYPLQLMALSTPKAQSSQWVRVPDEVEVTVHPDSSPVPDGELVIVISPTGSLTARVRCDARQRRDVVLMPKGGHWHAGQSGNALISARTTDIGDGGALYDDYVRLEGFPKGGA